jgi:HlyD family secretion protein
MALSKQLRRYRGWIAFAVLVVIGGTVFALTRASGNEAPETLYTTEVASIGTLAVTVSGTGNLEIDGTTDVYPDVAGTVASIEVAKGESVTTGTVLFTLKDTDVESAIDKAYSEYTQAKQGVLQAESQLLKAESSLDQLESRSSDPSATVEVRDSDIDAAELDVEAAELSLDNAKTSRSNAWTSYQEATEARDDLEVASPASGVVYSLGVEVGDAVSASGGGTGSDSTSGATTGAVTNDPPVVIAPEQPLAVHLTVNEVDLPTLTVGQRADVEFDALSDVTATGKVYEISDEGSNEQGVVTFDVWISLDVAHDSLRAGMSSAATIVTQIAKDALLVPNGAVKTNTDDGSYYVEVLSEGATTPEQVTVEVGLSNATQTQILSGLSEGDPVVTTTSTSSSTEDDEESGGFGGSGAGGGIMVPGMGGGPQ